MHDTVGIRKGQGAQQHSVDGAEYGRVRRDPDANDEDGHHGEERRCRQPTDRVAYILEEQIHHDHLVRGWWLVVRGGGGCERGAL